MLLNVLGGLKFVFGWRVIERNYIFLRKGFKNKCEGSKEFFDSI